MSHSILESHLQVLWTLYFFMYYTFAFMPILGSFDNQELIHIKGFVH